MAERKSRTPSREQTEILTPGTVVENKKLRDKGKILGYETVGGVNMVRARFIASAFEKYDSLVPAARAGEFFQSSSLEVKDPLVVEYLRLAPEDRPLADLLLVGPNKPMGYLYGGYIEENGVKPDELAQRLTQRGLKVYRHVPTVRYKGRERVFPEAVYAYDEEALRKLLEENRAVLEEKKWPVDPHEFVVYAEGHTARGAKLERVLSRAFGNWFMNRQLMAESQVRFQNAWEQTFPDINTGQPASPNLDSDQNQV